MKRIQIVFLCAVAMAVTVTGCGHGAEPKGTATGDSLGHDLAIAIKELDSIVGDSARGKQFTLGVEVGGDTMVWRGKVPGKPGQP